MKWLGLLLLLLPMPLLAQGLEAITVTTGPDGEQNYSLTIQVLLLMTVLTFIPAVVMMMTSFTRIIIVLAILRQAIGLQQPASQIIVGMALFLTFFIMAPVFERINETAIQPYFDEAITLQQALRNASRPLHQFMMGQVREPDLALFAGLAGHEEGYESPDDVPLNVLVPAFVTSELKTAFQIGFLLFIPFLVIDLVVASVLMSMGMMMLSPMMISLPFKIMLFVLIDGWSLIMSTLATSFYVT